MKKREKFKDDYIFVKIKFKTKYYDSTSPIQEIFKLIHTKPPKLKSKKENPALFLLSKKKNKTDK